MSNIRPISSQLQKKANEELNEVETRISQDVEYIRSWLKKQIHLKARMDDQWLVTFLRGCKYSLEKTKMKLDLFYTMRTSSPEFFKDWQVPSIAITDILEKSSIMILDRNPPKPVLCLLKWNEIDYEKCTLVDVVRFFLMILDVFLAEDDHIVISGVEVILDFFQYPLTYVLQSTPTVVKTIGLILQAYPLRIKAMHAINVPPILETTYSVIKVFFGKKFDSKLSIFSSGNMQEFYKRVPKHLLPSEYGGSNDSVNSLAAHINKKVESSKEFFLNEEQYGSIENLRPSSGKRPDVALEFDGSFRKLNID